MFTDDTSISYSGSNFETMETDINNDLISLNEWAKIWLVDYNLKKTKALVIANVTPPEINNKFSCETVETVVNHKDSQTTHPTIRMHIPKTV
jgi:hypothetical protein